MTERAILRALSSGLDPIEWTERHGCRFCDSYDTDKPCAEDPPCAELLETVSEWHGYKATIPPNDEFDFEIVTVVGPAGECVAEYGFSEDGCSTEVPYVWERKWCEESMRLHYLSALAERARALTPAEAPSGEGSRT